MWWGITLQALHRATRDRMVALQENSAVRRGGEAIAGVAGSAVPAESVHAVAAEGRSIAATGHAVASVDDPKPSTKGSL